MSKWFEVPIDIHLNVLVEVEDDEGKEEAAQIALEEIHYSNDAEVIGDDILELEEHEVENARITASEIVEIM